MATYYQWKKSNYNVKLYSTGSNSVVVTQHFDTEYNSEFYIGSGYQFNSSDGTLTLQNAEKYIGSGVDILNGEFLGLYNGAGNLALYSPYQMGDYTNPIETDVYGFGATLGVTSINYSFDQTRVGIVEPRPTTFIENVISLDSSAYPNNGVLNNFYYGNRTSIQSPLAPTGLTYPSVISGIPVNVSWTAAVSNIPAYAVSNYEVSYTVNGGVSWTVAGTTAETNLNVTIPPTATSIQFRVRAQDSNNQWSSYATGSTSQVLISPTLTVPSLAMQGQNITINWTAVTGATSYTLQRQANTDDGWQQVYSGSNLTFTETVGTWTSVQYQVQAVFSSGAGPWATSSSIPVIEASALVISGTDSNLGTITSDIPYTVSSDTGNDITLTRTVNGVQVASLTVQSGFAYNIPVVDLPTGTGTIVISASVNTSGGFPVTATRTWTYTKTAMTFPNSAGIGQLAQNGQNIWPLTVPDAIKTPAYLGGDLGKTLEMLGPLALAGAKIETGSYIGTGQTTLNLTLSETCNFILITANQTASQSMVSPLIIIKGMSETEFLYFSDGPWLARSNISWEGGNLIVTGSGYTSLIASSFSTPSSGAYVANVSGQTYYYAAISV